MNKVANTIFICDFLEFPTNVPMPNLLMSNEVDLVLDYEMKCY